MAVWVFVNLSDHGSEKWRLRTSEIVGAVCVEDCSVVFDFEEEVFDHVAGEVCALVFDQAEDDEVAVPAVHLVEAAAGHNVGVGQIEETFVRNFSYANVAHMCNFARQVPTFNSALLLNRTNGGGDGHALRQVENWRRRDPWIDN